MTAAPPSPASPPEITIDRTVDQAMLMPAYRAADGLRPTARNSNPFVERKRNQLTTMAATMAIDDAPVDAQPVDQRGEEGAVLHGLRDRVAAALALDERRLQAPSR